MGMKLTLLGTGDVRQLPVFGCDCIGCQRARSEPGYRRKPCSAELQLGDLKLLIDGGLTDLAERYQPGELSAILLTHYHVDHVQGLFHLRWGLGPSIPVIGPDDTNGCADLLKHSGMLDFQPAPPPFETIRMGELRITPLPLQHSKPTFGYLFQHQQRNLAYLTDTVGLPDATLDYLKRIPALELVIDCSHPPQQSAPRNHNDLNLVLEIQQQLKPDALWLTHISHEMECWLLENTLPAGIFIGQDDQSI